MAQYRSRGGRQKVSGKPLVVHIHATEYDRTGGAGFNQTVYEIEKRGLALADKICAVSQYTKHVLVDYYGADADKITVVHNGVEAPKASAATMMISELLTTDRPLVLFLGRITLQKGPEYFLQAAKLSIDHYQCQGETVPLFVMAGSGDMEAQMVRLAAELGISEHVLFTGFVRGEEREALYRAASLFVMPSVSEPFGIVPLEAAQQNTPVLISKQSGVGEVLSNSLRVDFWDVEEMANKMVCCLRHKELAATLCQESGCEVLHITWAKAAKKCVMLYKQLTTS